MTQDEKARERALSRACAVLDLSIKNFKASVHNAVACANVDDNMHQQFRRAGRA